MRLKQSIPFIICVLGLALDRTALWCVYRTGECVAKGLANVIFESVLTPFFLYSLVCIVPCAALVFVSRNAFSAWKKFAIWWLPLSIALIALSPAHPQGGFFILFDPLKEDVAKAMAVLFSIGSIFVIARAYLRAGRDRAD